MARACHDRTSPVGWVGRPSRATFGREVRGVRRATRGCSGAAPRRERAMSRRSTGRWAVVLAPLTALALAVTPAASSTSAQALVPARGSTASGTAYSNPVSRPFADTFADPSVIRGKDGFWYAYGTSDPLREGETTPHRIPIARSSDLVHWSYVGDAFTAATVPTWAAPDAGLWAPDIRYVDGQYRLYYVVTQTTVTPGPNDNAIGMATAPTPAGPWTDSGAPVAGPRPGASGKPDDFLWTFDPSAVTDVDGSQWLFYGSYYGGLHVAPLSQDGRKVTGPARMVAIDNKFEGAYVVRHGGYWYLFASTANCCAGPTTGYSVQVGRSRDLRGPYVDREGVSLTASRAGGTPALNQNGNQWVGSGHNAIATDLAGQDWNVYHAIDRSDPYLNGTDGINERPMLMHRLDWVDGWPVTRAGLGPSSGTQPGPVTSGRLVTTFDDGGTSWARTGSWSQATDPQSGRYVRSRTAGTVLTRAALPGDVRTEADLRASGAAHGLVVRRGAHSEVRLTIDPAARTARLSSVVDGVNRGASSAPLPADYDPTDWHSASLEVRGGRAHAQLTHARLNDPLADLTLTVPARPGATPTRAGAWAGGAGVGIDNLSATRAADLVTARAPLPVPSRLDPTASDEFNGGALGSGWSWVRRDAAAHVAAGSLVWPVEQADLTGPDNNAGAISNNAGVLLRDLP